MASVCLPLCLLVLYMGASASVLGTQKTPNANIAFHIRWTSENAGEAKTFLDRIYHEENIYLFDIPDPLGIANLQLAFQKHTNVYVRNVDHVVPKGVSEALWILDGISFFLDKEDARKSAFVLSRPRLFDFYVALTSSHFPLVSPSTMRIVLGSSLSQNLSPTFMRFSHPSHWPHFGSEFNELYYDASLVFSQNERALKALLSTKFRNPDHSYRVHSVARTEKDMVFSYDFAKFAVDSMLSKRVLSTFGESANVVEHFFGTLGVAADNVTLLVRTTSLHCPETIGLDTPLSSSTPLRYSRPLFSAQGVLEANSPCLFALVDSSSTHEIGEAKGLLHNEVNDAKSSRAHVARASEMLHLHLSLALKGEDFPSRPARFLHQPL